ncbi:hypothetical protein DSECCO2_589250 [anaerobic digester metagenome]
MVGKQALKSIAYTIIYLSHFQQKQNSGNIILIYRFHDGRSPPQLNIPIIHADRGKFIIAIKYFFSTGNVSGFRAHQHHLITREEIAGYPAACNLLNTIALTEGCINFSNRFPETISEFTAAVCAIRSIFVAAINPQCIVLKFPVEFG